MAKFGKVNISRQVKNTFSQNDTHALSKRSDRITCLLFHMAVQTLRWCGTSGGGVNGTA